MKINSLIISILIFSGVGVILFTQVIPEWYSSDGYQVTIQDEYAGAVEVYNETNALAISIRDSSPGGSDATVDPDSTLFGSLSILLTPLSFIMQLPSLVWSLLTGISEKIDIHPVFIGMFFTGILICITMIAISAFTNNKT